MFTAFWVYDSIGIKVGKFVVDNLDWSNDDAEAKLEAAMQLWCTQQGLERSDYNCCVAGK